MFVYCLFPNRYCPNASIKRKYVYMNECILSDREGGKRQEEEEHGAARKLQSLLHSSVQKDWMPIQRLSAYPPCVYISLRLSRRGRWPANTLSRSGSDRQVHKDQKNWGGPTFISTQLSTSLPVIHSWMSQTPTSLNTYTLEYKITKFLISLCTYK